MSTEITIEVSEVHADRLREILSTNNIEKEKYLCSVVEKHVDNMFLELDATERRRARAEQRGGNAIEEAKDGDDNVE